MHTIPRSLSRVCAALGVIVWVVGLGSGCQPARSGGGGGGGGAANDRDGDGLLDDFEVQRGTDVDNPDSDGDGLLDGAEVAMGTSPLSRDTDNDGLDDPDDPDPRVPADEPEPGEDDGSTDGLGDGGTGGDGEEPPPVEEGPVAEAEPNDTFEGADAAEFDEGDTMEIEGSIDAGGDIDVYDLGALAAGDRLTVEVQRTGGFFDAALAVFDEDGDVFAIGDDASEESAVEADQVIRHDSEHYYLAISHGTVLTAPGDYTIDVRVSRGLEPPAPAGQIVYLDFEGGTVEDPLLGTVELPPFDAADVNPDYADDTGQVQTAILETILENFADYDLTVLTSSADARPEEDSFATVYFGGFNRSDFGVSEGVDAYNSNPSDTAIVYTDSFTPDAFSEPISAEELGTAIGNVTSRQIGHLVGLYAVDHPPAVMGQDPSGDTLLQDQAFSAADLAADVFPLGAQDAPALLLEILGPR
ncbi:MAG: hypothetical protein GY778_30575 [bacterium]|nr:hypothetical protein [bacterium]